MSPFSQQRGVGLVEVLVAVLLLSVAVLGFSALQLRAISATDESLIRTQALSVVRGLSENMRANPLQMDAYETAINAADPSAAAPDSEEIKCVSLKEDKTCTATEIAVKESEAAVDKLYEHGVAIKIDTCPGTADFSEIKCIIAAWGDTKALMDDTDTQACAKANGTYKSGSTCVIVEAY